MQQRDTLAALAGSVDVVVTSFETIRSDNTKFSCGILKQGQYVTPLDQFEWWRVVVDESQVRVCLAACFCLRRCMPVEVHALVARPS